MKWTFGNQKLEKSLGYILDVSEADPDGSFVRARQRSLKDSTSAAQIRMMSPRCSHGGRSVKKLQIFWTRADSILFRTSTSNFLELRSVWISYSV